jgi:hypothetical protein
MNAYVENLYNNIHLVPYSIDITSHVKYLGDTSKNQEVVELGVRCGVSTVCFLSGCKKLTSYDIVQTEEAKKLAHECPEWSFNLADSLKIEIPECDILFIDTAHTYEQLLKELNLHNDKVKKLIIMHDTNMPELKRSIQEFLNSHPKWSIAREVTDSNGLTTLSSM